MAHLSLLSRLILGLALLAHLVTAGVAVVSPVARADVDAAAVAASSAGKLAARQQSGGDPLSNAACMDYSRTANLSVLAENITYRSAWLFASSTGTQADLNMLMAAMAALPPLMADEGLNENCGNLTEVALAGAEANFTQGIVGPFSGLPAEIVVTSGIEVIITVSLCCLVMGIPWLFMLG